MKKTILEDKFLFRLVKVTYILALVVGILFVTFMGWSKKPEKYIDNNKSILSCVKSGKSDSLDNLGIHLYEKELGTYIFEGLDADNDMKARLVCGYGEEIKDLKAKIKLARVEKIPEEIILQKLGEGVVAGRYELPKEKVSDVDNVLPSKSNSDYKIDYIYSTSGSWLSVFLWWIVGSLVIIAVFTLIRNTINYILFGRHF